MIYLRGEENKVKFKNEYDLKPISHQKLLNGQTKDSVGGSELTDRYYCFLYNKKGEKKQKTFICGYHVANRLLELTNQSPLPLFNPLQVQTVQRDNQNRGANENHNVRQWDNVALQLSNAINLFIAYWDKPIYGALAKIHLEVNKYFYKTPFDGKVKAVNTCLDKIIPDKTLKDIQEELSKDNDIREFNFDLLNEILDKHNVKSKFGCL